MATATALGLQIARRCHDTSQVEITAAGYLDFINMALDDLAAAGWLEPQVSDESLILASSDYDYNVPSGFAYLSRITVADSDGEFPQQNEVPQHQWHIDLDVASTPEIYFRPDVFDQLISGRALKVVGQKRPSTGVAGSATIVAGMEAFVRERATSYALEHLADGLSELSQTRMRRSEQTWAKSEQMLGRHPMEFRVKPNSLYVPGR